jgi:hypothetical protein
MGKDELHVKPLWDFPLFAETCDIDNLLVEIDTLRFVRENYVPSLLDEEPPSLMVVGERGSGKTTLMHFIENELLSLSHRKKVLPLYLSMNTYGIVSFQDFGLEFYVGVIRSMSEALAARNVGEEWQQYSKLLSRGPPSVLLRELPMSRIEKMVQEVLERISPDYSGIAVLIDNLDKYVPEVYQNVIGFLDEYKDVYERMLVRPLDSIGLEYTVIMAANPTHHDVLLRILKRLKDTEIMSVDLNWDLGYLYELIRKRIAFSSNHEGAMICDLFDDEAIFKLFLSSQKNPRLFQNLCRRSIDVATESDSLPIDGTLVDTIVSEYSEDRLPWPTMDEQFVTKYGELYARAISSENGLERGESLQCLAEYIFESIDGVSIKARKKLTESGELDIFLKNERDVGVWRHLGDPILVECKNLSKPAGIDILRKFVDAVRDKRLKTGILFSAKGVSGDRTKFARRKIHDAFKEGVYILDFGMEDLENIYEPEDFERMLDDKRFHLHMNA